MRRCPVVVCVVLIVWAGVLWACEEEPGPFDPAITAADCEATITEACPALEATVSHIETMVAIIEPTCLELWREKYGTFTLTVVASATPGAVATATPQEGVVTPPEGVVTPPEGVVTRTPPASVTPVPSATAGEVVATATPEPEFLSVTVASTQDSYIYAYEPHAYLGLSSVIRLGSKDRYRPLLRFDVGVVPAEAAVAQATAWLWVYSWSGLPLTTTVYVVYRPWDIASWESADVAVPWAVPGCGGAGLDRDEEISSRVRLFGIKQWVGVDVTLAVRRWLAGLPNYGVVLYSDAVQASYAFVAAESADAGHRPRLEVVYHNPEWR